ncbi:Hydroxyproline-rich glycoprotein family protein [Quillaja saponaria]|uniref:Hydroxyproline-rich glycoprotein family protein n=1 Tax=Quillaja saponaria TaxID=32244 RepID=A0AAD7PN74_QUISA|nr:Hydroxyproline-rich glycoprotein family protein [Quillaja saponaria]
MKNGGLDHLMKGTPCPKPRKTYSKDHNRNMQHLPKRAAQGFEDHTQDKMKNGGLDHLMKGTPCPKTRKTSSKDHNRNMQHLPKRAAQGFEDHIDSEFENLQVSSDEDAMSGCVNDAGSDSNEVDKKAGEFIAKFREQIRLQKMASIEDI